jgi:hypothetical protein
MSKQTQINHRALFKASRRFLQAHKSLLVFPGLGVVLSLTIAIFIIKPLRHIETEAIQSHLHIPSSSIITVIAAIYLLLFICNFITHCTESALVDYTANKIQNKPASLLKSFWRMLIDSPRILWMQVLAIGLNIIHFLLPSAVQRFLKLERYHHNVRWPIANYFALPSLTLGRATAKQSFNQSGRLLNENWGTKLTDKALYGRTKVLFIRILVTIPVIACVAIDQHLIPSWALLSIVIFSQALISIFVRTLQGITRDTLYLYVTNGIVTDGYSKETLDKALLDK